jgi:hypothetical protein
MEADYYKGASYILGSNNLYRVVTRIRYCRLLEEDP